MKRFRVDLKTFLGLAMSNQCCHAVTKLIILGWFVGGVLGKKPQTLMIPIYSITVLYDTVFRTFHLIVTLIQTLKKLRNSLMQ